MTDPIKRDDALKLCPSCHEPLDYTSGDGCAAMQLHKERMMDDLIQRLHHYANGDCDMTPVCSTLLEAVDLIEQTEDKLAKAMAALQLISQMHGYTSRQLSDIARTVLAELEGQG